MSSTYGGVDPAAIAPLVAPMLLATTLPLPEAVTPEAGTPHKASASDHQHQRLTSAGYVTTDASGIGTYNSDQAFINPPCPFFCAMNNPGVSYDVVSWIRDAQNNYVGLTFRATKRTTVTQLVNTVVALVSVITGVTTQNTDAPVPNQLTSVTLLKQSKVA